ncbi:MAG: hypothetical protein CTY34_01925 [Methylobacter sp.]|nr:MAG: hypothetical protein CTY34_01925 [Methylobacter sp.]PPD04427.1 MAG: hypothetical protein CTY29_05650 [Methylobacter sp.]PPD22027.1 MAG: hypothetical protein CTY24_06915 [Methylobacter sp.]PPD37199.1 MAG: hypothetical protein CTY18_02510 [Methylomonas sp.]
MINVTAIVEGDGEVIALPVLLRRLNEWLTPEVYVDVGYPIRVRRDRFLSKDDEFRRHLSLAAHKCGNEGWILILFDADDDCPAELGQKILRRAQNIVPHRRISVVLANREYEAWFIAAAESLQGNRGFNFDPTKTVNPEQPRDAKGWIEACMTNRSYGETTDQPAFSALIDLQLAFDRSRSFRKLCSEWNKRSGVSSD